MRVVYPGFTTLQVPRQVDKLPQRKAFWPNDNNNINRLAHICFLLLRPLRTKAQYWRPSHLYWRSTSFDCKSHVHHVHLLESVRFESQTLAVSSTKTLVSMQRCWSKLHIRADVHPLLEVLSRSTRFFFCFQPFVNSSFIKKQDNDSNVPLSCLKFFFCFFFAVQHESLPPNVVNSVVITQQCLCSRHQPEW